MTSEQVVIALIFAALGAGVSAVLDRWRDRQRMREVQQAIADLQVKGFQVSFDKVTMELVRMTGYTVLKDGKPYGWRISAQ